MSPDKSCSLRYSRPPTNHPRRVEYYTLKFILEYVSGVCVQARGPWPLSKELPTGRFPAMTCGRKPSARVAAAYAGLCALPTARWHPREQYVCKRAAWHHPPRTLLASPDDAHPAAAAAAQPARSAPSRLEDKLRGTSKSLPTADETIYRDSDYNHL